MTEHTPDDLPTPPPGMFWRVGYKPSGLGFKYVQVSLRRTLPLGLSVAVDKKHALPAADSPKHETDRDIALWLARKIMAEYAYRTSNRNTGLGALEGDHYR